MSGDSIGRFSGLMNRADWTNPDPNCVAVDAAVPDLFAPEIGWVLGDNKGMWGEFYDSVAVTLPDGTSDTIQIVVFDRGLWNEPEILSLETLLHEAGHLAGFGHTGAFDAYDAENCAVLKPTEEEDDDPDPEEPGGGEDPTGKCEEEQVWVEPVTRKVFKKPDSSTGQQRQVSDHEADYDLPGIVVSASSKGRWVEEVIEEGYWKTVTVCED